MKGHKRVACHAVCTCGWSYPERSDRIGIERLYQAAKSHLNGNSRKGQHIVTRVKHEVTRFEI